MFGKLTASITILIALPFSALAIPQEIRSGYMPKTWNLPRSCEKHFSSPHCFEDIGRFVRDTKWMFHKAHDATFENYDHHVFRVGPRRTPIAILFLHGLWANSVQFNEVFPELIYADVNFLAVNYSGHGRYAKYGTSVSYQDWIQDAVQAARLARSMGEKLVIVGQSTGAALAIHLALHHPELVQGLVLIEPAIKVRSSRIALSCLGKRVIDFAQDAEFLADLLGVYRPDYPIAVQMGCEVSKILEPEIATSREEREPYSKKKNGNSPTSSLEKTKELARKILVPTAVINASNDKIVHPKFVRVFAENLEQVQTYYKEHNFDHGDTRTIMNIKLLQTIDTVMGTNLQLESARRRNALRDSFIHQNPVPSWVWRYYAKAFFELSQTHDNPADRHSTLTRALRDGPSLSLHPDSGPTCPAAHFPERCLESVELAETLVQAVRKASIAAQESLSEYELNSLRYYSLLKMNGVIEKMGEWESFRRAAEIYRARVLEELGHDADRVITFFKHAKGIDAGEEYLNADRQLMNPDGSREIAR